MRHLLMGGLLVGGQSLSLGLSAPGALASPASERFSVQPQTASAAEEPALPATAPATGSPGRSARGETGSSPMAAAQGSRGPAGGSAATPTPEPAAASAGGNDTTQESVSEAVTSDSDKPAAAGITTPPDPAPSAGGQAPPPAGWSSLDQLLSLPGWLTLNLSVNAAPIANPIGGLTAAANWMQQIELEATAGLGLDRDRSSWREIDHWQAHLRLDLYSGAPSFARTIGALIAPQNMAYPPGLWLSGASLSRSNRSDSFAITAGLRSLDPDFLAAPVYSFYLFSAINDTLNLNIIGLPITPFTSPAVSLRWRSGGLGNWHLGAWWLGGQAETASLFGVNTGRPYVGGDLQILQWSAAPRLAGFDTTAPIPLPGGGSEARQLPPPLLQLGGFRSRVTSAAAPTTLLRVAGVGVNHVVYGSVTLPARLPLGLDNRLWSAVQIDLNRGRNGTPLFLGGGWLCQGLFPDRPLDVLALGVAGTVFSRELLQELSNQIAMELNYSFTINSRLSLQPVLQWIVRPTGTSEQAAIVTTALQIVLTF